MREKKRYLFVKGKNLGKNIEKAILEFVGISGLKKTGLSFVKSNSNSAVIAVNREAVNSVRASLVVYPEKMIVEKVSGSVGKVK